MTNLCEHLTSLTKKQQQQKPSLFYLPFRKDVFVNRRLGTDVIYINLLFFISPIFYFYTRNTMRINKWKRSLCFCAGWLLMTFGQLTVTGIQSTMNTDPFQMTKDVTFAQYGLETFPIVHCWHSVKSVLFTFDQNEALSLGKCCLLKYDQCGRLTLGQYWPADIHSMLLKETIGIPYKSIQKIFVVFDQCWLLTVSKQVSKCKCP